MKPIARFCFIPVILVLSVFPAAGQTNSISALKSSHEMALLEVGAACVQREKDALKQYGKALDALLETLQKKGDLEGVLLLQAEKNRFEAEKTVPAPTDAKDSFRRASEAYYRALVALLGQHAAALDELIKKEVMADRIEEAKVVRAEKDKVAFVLADMQMKLPAKALVAPSKQEESDKVRPTAAGRLSHPEDARPFGRHWYKEFNEIASWDEAVKRCRDMRGYLACVTSSEENAFIASLTEGRAMWLGASDAQKEGKWKWVSGEAFRFNKWFPGQPANDGGDSDYLHIGIPWMNKPEDWNDGPLDYDQVVGFICEWEK